MSYRFNPCLTESEYRKFAVDHPLYNIYQSYEWAAVKKEWQHRFVGVYDNDCLQAAGLVLIRPLPLGFTLFYLPRGPLIDFENQPLLCFFFEELKRYARRERAIEIKVDPNVLLSSVPYKEVRGAAAVRQSIVIDRMTELGFVHHGFNKDMYETAQPRYCAALYFSKDWPQDYKPKAIRSINKALRRGIETEVIGPEKLDEFSELMEFTERRKGVSLRNREYYQRIVDAYQKDCFMVLTKLDLRKQLEINRGQLTELKDILKKSAIAEYKLKKIRDQVESIEKDIVFQEQAHMEDGDCVYISCLLAVRTNETTELLYAGMNEKYKKYMAPYVSYFEGIKWAHDKGSKVCGFGGIEGTLDDGLTEFKGYFDPNIDEYVGEFDLAINRPVYFMFTKAVPVYKAIRRFLRGIKQ